MTAGAPSASKTAFGSISSGELSVAARLAHQAYQQEYCRPLPGCREDSKYIRLAPAGHARTYFAFPGSHSALDWQINALHSMQPLKDWAGGLPDLAKLAEPAHQGFVERLSVIAGAKSSPDEEPMFTKSFDEAVKAHHRIVFVGHSMGGAVAMLATIWALTRVSNVALSADVACITFGAPLVGGAELSRLVRSKGWDGLIHQVVWRHDLVPRVLLSLGTGAQKGLAVLIDKLPRAWPRGAPESAEVVLSSDEEKALDKLRVGVKEKSASLFSRIMAAGTYLRAAGSAGKRMMTANEYSPFGLYLLHTDCGSLLCDDPDEAEHMLYLTMLDLSKAVGARPRYGIDEHMMPRYLSAVSAICKDTKTKRNDWSVMLHSTESLFEFLLYKRFNEFSDDLKELLRLVTTADSNTKVQAEREQVKDWREADEKLSDKWQEKVQDYYEFLIDYTKELERRTAEPATQFPLAEKFRLKSLPEDTLKKVEDARRKIRDFWRMATSMYIKRELPPDSFTRPSVWLTRGRTCQRYVEPIDIANYYRKELWKEWLPGRRHYTESNNRPEYFVFLEEQFLHEYPDEPFVATLPYAQRLADECNRAVVPKELDQVAASA